MQPYGSVVAKVTQRFPRNLVSMVLVSTLALLLPAALATSNNVVCKYVIAPLLLAGVLYAWYLIAWGMRSSVTLYERGIALEGWGCRFSGPLGAVARSRYVRVQLVNQYNDKRGRYDSLYVETSDSQSTELQLGILGDRESAWRIHQTLLDPLLTQAKARFVRGEAVDFGAISVSKARVVCEGVELPISVLRGFCVSDFDVQLCAADGRVVSVALPIDNRARASKVSNPEVLSHLLASMLPEVARREPEAKTRVPLATFVQTLSPKYKLAAAGAGALMLAAVIAQVAGTSAESKHTIHVLARLSAEGYEGFARQSGTLRADGKEFAKLTDGTFHFDVARGALEDKKLPKLTLNVDTACGPQTITFHPEGRHFSQFDLDRAEQRGNTELDYFADDSPSANCARSARP